MYVDDDERVDAWADNLDNQEDEIYELLPKIQKEIEDIIRVPTKIIQYNDKSIRS